MKLDKDIQEIISKYLNRVETTFEREQLYQWFENAGNGDSLIDQEVIDDSLKRGKYRLLAEITNVNQSGRVRKQYWYRIAVACLVLILCSASLKYFIDKDELTLVSSAELSSIMPDHKKATITLSTGEVFNLDRLNNKDSVSIGNTVIKKDSLGQLVCTQGVNNTSSNVINTLQTSKGAQYTIILSDGTRVNLNATSTLSFPQAFPAGDRVVQLYGEAYFEVKKTLQHSKFIVKTNSQSIEVLGTKFNVNAYQNQAFVKTTLSEGSVRISPRNKSLKPVVLRPNQQATLRSGSIELARVNTKKVSEWKEGNFVFDGANSASTIREIGQWYGIDIDYQPENGAITYEGRIPKTTSLARLVELLNYAGIKVQVYKNKGHQYQLTIN